MCCLKKVENFITRSTMALLPANDGMNQTIILDLFGNRFSHPHSKLKILDDACLVRACSYDGRIKAVRTALHYFNKTPLMICPQDSIFAMPTKSPHDYDCIWLFHHHIKAFFIEVSTPCVLFKNGYRLKVDCSIYSLHKQWERTANVTTYFSPSKGIV
ncbi:competence protein ComK [Bacillus oleivorans]|uniref:Competence protein ComK n=1 Tax=Bacillus oleivorans TaxID=1448271 RepID=A0A285CJE7_9BACI|nr:competence protein ComK [Bacillus oleivorans]SNX67113.1 competence protein ComK [Bacillus oleivorans]